MVNYYIHVKNLLLIYHLFIFVYVCFYILARALVGTYLVSTGVGFYLYLLNDKEIDHYQVESRSALLALRPLLDAESDRE